MSDLSEDAFPVSLSIPEHLRLSVLKALYPILHDGYIFQDAQGVIQGYNEAACRILRIAPEKMLGKTSEHYNWRVIRQDGQTAPSATYPIAVTLKTGAPCYGVVLGVQKNQDAPRWLQVNSHPVFDESDSKMIGAVALFSDVTHDVSMKKALEKQHDSDDAAELAKRIRTQRTLSDLSEPAEAVVENAGAIRRRLAAGAPPEEIAKRLETIEEAGARIMASLADLAPANPNKS